MYCVHFKELYSTMFIFFFNNLCKCLYILQIYILHTHVSLIIDVFNSIQDNKNQLMDLQIQYII